VSLSRTLGTGQVNPGVSRVEIYYNNRKENDYGFYLVARDDGAWRIIERHESLSPALAWVLPHPILTKDSF
jgi:hypothetical protein